MRKGMEGRGVCAIPPSLFPSGLGRLTPVGGNFKCRGKEDGIGEFLLQ